MASNKYEVQNTKKKKKRNKKPKKTTTKKKKTQKNKKTLPAPGFFNPGQAPEPNSTTPG
jgi:hypothetical protein